MKRSVLAAAFLLACLCLHARPALASEQFTISADRQTVIFNGKTYSLPAKPSEAYYAVKNGGIAAVYVKPDGSPGVIDPDNSFMVADAFGCGFQCLTYDSNNYLDVDVKTGSITATTTLPYNGTGGEAQKNNGAVVVMFGDSGGDTTFSPGTNDGSASKNINVNVNAQGLSALTSSIKSAATGGATSSSLLSFASSASAQTVKSGAGTLYKVQWDCGSAMTSTTTVTVYDNTSAAGKQLGVYTFLAGGYDQWTLPGGAFTLGLTLVTSTTTTQGGCGFMVWYT